MIETRTTFVVSGIPDEDLDRIRAAGHDDHGNALVPRTVEAGGQGSPLRCCLRESREGDRIALIAYRPPGGRGIYSEVGPVFIHAERCDGYATPDRFPPAYRHRQQILRAYNHEGTISDAVLVAGDSADPVIAHLLSRPEVASVEGRNVLYGCFSFNARPAS